MKPKYFRLFRLLLNDKVNIVCKPLLYLVLAIQTRRKIRLPAKTGRLLLAACICFYTGTSGSAMAQAANTKIHLGLIAPVAMKFQLLPADAATSYEAWGHLAICLVTVIEGTDENALSILAKTGFSLDITTYRSAHYSNLIMERANLICNPEIMFPTRIKRMKITAGIGVEWNGYFLAQFESGSLGTENNFIEEVNKKGRKIFPFISAGLLYNLKNDFYVQVFIRQVMTGYFSEEANILLSNTSFKPDMVLNDKPTFAGLGIAYFFHRK